MIREIDGPQILNASQVLYENCVFILAQNYYDQSMADQNFPSEFKEFDHQKIAEREFSLDGRNPFTFEVIEREAPKLGLNAKILTQSIYDKAKPVAFEIA